MAQPSTRQGLIDYCLRRLGAPVLEINVDDDQIDDLVDDALQYFQERHFDGVERMYLKYQISQADIDRGRGRNTDGVGIVTTSATSTSIAGYGTTTSNFYETSTFIQIPDSVIGIERIFRFDTSAISGGMFSIKYQLFLNDLYYFNSVDLLQYAMTKSYLEDIDHLLTTDKQVRYNKRQDRLYLDIDWKAQKAGDYIVIDCAPSLGLLTVNALVAADRAIIPVQCEYFALEGIAGLVQTLTQVKDHLNPNLEIGGIVLTMFDKRTSLNNQVVDNTRRFFKNLVFNTIVPRNIRLTEAPSHGIPITLYDSSSTGAIAYKSLAEEVMLRV